MGGEARLAIVAGRGALPRRIAEHRAAAGLPYLVVAFEGLTSEWMAAHPHAVQPIERPGALFAALARAGVDAVVFAGAMDRPRLRPWRLDLTGLRLAPRLLRLLRRGDDTLLSALARLFEARGFRVVGAQSCLPGLTVGAGTLGRHPVPCPVWADARRGAAILAALGPLDVGQAVAVARGICLGIEAIEGTDALLARVAALPPGKRGPTPSGVLLKMAKPGQDRRLDLPTIGPATVAGAAAAGLAAILVEAEAANILDRADTVAAADAAGIALAAILAEDLAPPAAAGEGAP